MPNSEPSPLVIQNITREGPGSFTDMLDADYLPYRVVDLSQAQPLPNPDLHNALIVLGGPQSANDNSQHIVDELRYIDQWLDAGKPYLGVCLGMQMLVKAAGGQVIQSPVKEVGFWDSNGLPYKVELTSKSKDDPLLAWQDSRGFNVFHLHGESVDLAGTEIDLLGTSEHVPNQIVRLGDSAWGIQGHVELTAEMLDRWLAEDDDLRSVDAETYRQFFEINNETYARIGRTIMKNFLDIAWLRS